MCRGGGVAAACAWSTSTGVGVELGGLVLGLGKWEVMVGVICVKGSVGSTGCVCCCCSSSGGEVRMRLVQSDPRTLHHPCSFISWMVRYFS